MVTKIVDAISVKLHEIFGDKCRIYSEDIEQGFCEPCFFISILSPSQEKKLMQRYYRKYLFDISYFPKTPNNAELCDVAECLLDCMEFITLHNNELLHGTKMRYELQDNTLHFFVNYNLFVVKPKEIVDMETLKIINGTLN